MSLAERLAALGGSVIPVWVYDHDAGRFRWANAAALPLWRADSLDELLARDFSGNSESSRTRLDNYLQVLRGGGVVSEDWTLYPRGRPETMTLHGSGVQLDDGRLAILFQAVRKAEPVDPSMVRGVEALRHTSLIVSLLAEDGAAIFHNPAALRAFGDAPTIGPWFGDAGAELLASVRRGEAFEAELPVRRVDGERWHALRAAPAVDPVTGARAVLLQQIDIHQRRDAEDLAATRSRLVDQLGRTLAVVEQQRQQILALSAPLLDVGDHTLAVPLIGDLTRERIREIGERLLPALHRGHRRHLILDLTGCSALDEAGAVCLGELIAAAALLGSRSVLTGIAPGLAQAMIAANLDLSRSPTLRTLRDGIDHCRDATA